MTFDLNTFMAQFSDGSGVPKSTTPKKVAVPKKVPVTSVRAAKPTYRERPDFEGLTPYEVELEIRALGIEAAQRAERKPPYRGPMKKYGRHNPSDVGGTTDLMKAIYAPPDTKLCKVVSDARGWKTGNKPNRL